VNPIFALGEKKDKPFIFTSVGNLIPLKRMELLIRGFCLAFGGEDAVKLEIIGEGAERQNLESIIAQEGREGQITLHGLLPRAEVAEQLAASHAFCLVSERETFGVAYIEGLAAGNVLIGAHNGGADDIITAGNGIMIEDASPAGVASAMRQIYDTYGEYVPESISREALAKYGQSAFGAYYSEMFRTLHQRR
jgi:glycosyltransferase involved in cell wall biosynthesis